MYDPTLTQHWVITCERDNIRYYLSETDGFYSKVVWTKRTSKAKKYSDHSTAMLSAESVKHFRKLGKVNINVARVQP